jgi:DNA polymerase III sliding clamp (beta) subunit (PCNA family)
VKLTVLREHFSPALALAKRASGSKILTQGDFALLEAQPESLRITCTDGILSVVAEIEASVEEQGTVAVESSRLASLVSSMANGEVKVELKDNRLTVRQGRSRAALEVFPHENFPHHQTIEEATAADEVKSSFSLDSKLLAYSVNAVSSALDEKAHSPVLRGIAVKDMSLVGADGLRLGIAAVPTHMAETVIVDPRLLALPLSGQVQAWFSDKRAWLVADGVCASAPLIKGTYPPIEQFVLQFIEAEVFTVDAAELNTEIERALTVLPKEEAHLRLGAGDGMSLTSREDYTGTISCSPSFTGGIAFNANFLRDALRPFKEGELTIKYLDEKKPVLFAQGDITYILYPIWRPQ